ncbi:MAG: hypothetical protein R3A10_09700 [Caldilineaceae bacterium]
MPFCLTMMTDAAKSEENGMVVKDVAEIIAERLDRFADELAAD